ncbi:MAG: hypothetical protein QNJ47_05515 [Nostocaceae cyanobacterium]|nr:hypothetical protein [Nostocaceae cyanobacterium]
MKKIKRFTYGIIGIVTISSIGLASAYALEVPIFKNTPLAEIVEQWQQQVNSVNYYVSSIVSRKLEPLTESLGQDLQAAINEAIGTLGLPDATEVRKKVEEIVIDSDSIINTVEGTTNEVERQITRAASDATLSKSGQQNTKEQIQKTQSSIEQIYADSNAAQSEVVTQNVMKRIAQQNTKIAGILGAMRTDGLKSKQSQNLANLNLTNISRSLDGQNQARQKETVGQGFSNLRTASQARLF